MVTIPVHLSNKQSCVEFSCFSLPAVTWTVCIGSLGSVLPCGFSSASWLGWLSEIHQSCSALVQRKALASDLPSVDWILVQGTRRVADHGKLEVKVKSGKSKEKAHLKKTNSKFRVNVSIGWTRGNKNGNFDSRS